MKEEKLEKYKRVQDKVQNLLEDAGNAVNEGLISLVAELGGNVEIKENFADGCSCITVYNDDDDYVQVESVYINDDNDLIVERNIDTCEMTELGIDDRQMIYDWILEQVEYPERFEDPNEDEDEEDIDNEE